MPFSTRSRSFHLLVPLLFLLTATAHFLLLSILCSPIFSEISKTPILFSSQKNSLVITLRQISTEPIFLCPSFIFITPKYTTPATVFELPASDVNQFVLIYPSVY